MDPCPAHLDYEVEDGEQDFFAVESWACNAGEHHLPLWIKNREGMWRRQREHTDKVVKSEYRSSIQSAEAGQLQNSRSANARSVLPSTLAGDTVSLQLKAYRVLLKACATEISKEIATNTTLNRMVAPKAQIKAPAALLATQQISCSKPIRGLQIGRRPALYTNQDIPCVSVLHGQSRIRIPQLSVVGLGQLLSWTGKICEVPRIDGVCLQFRSSRECISYDLGKFDERRYEGIKDFLYQETEKEIKIGSENIQFRIEPLMGNDVHSSI